jgi:phthalate 4,5-cis-dihydrodiol dehydrogenase
MVRSVRAGVSPAGPERTGDGQHTMLLQFVDGAVATAVYSGLAHFPSAELTFGIGEDGVAAQPGSYARARSALAAAEPGGERAMKGALGYSRPPSEGRPPLGFYGLTLVSGERGDIRQVPGGLMLYGDDGRHEIPVAPRPSGREALLDEVCEAIASDRPAAHDGRWGAANLEVTLAAWRSARSQREVILKRQVPVPRG